MFSETFSSEGRSAEIDKHTLFVETLNLAVGKGHHLAGRQTALNAAELEKESLVLLNTQFALRRHFDLYCLEYRITPHIAIETNSLNMLVQSASLGRLVTILPSSISEAQSGLHSVPLLPQLPHHAIALICHKGTYKSAACHAFGEMARQWSAARYHALQQRLDEASGQATLDESRDTGSARRPVEGTTGAIAR